MVYNCDGAGDITIKGTIIRYNVATFEGGGIYCANESSPTILNCLIVENEAGVGAEYGGGIYCRDDSDPDLINCTIESNASGGVSADSTSVPTLKNCIIWNNEDDLVGIDSSQVSYCDIENDDEGCAGQNGNISKKPKFVPHDEEGYYTGYYLAHAGAQAGNSPCIDAGTGAVEDYGLEGATTCTDGRADGDDDGDGNTGPIDMGYHHSEAYDGSDDTYIELASFEAKANGRSILISWETGTEIDNAGFNLYRVEAGDRMTPEKINDRLIPAKGCPAAGASYEFLDTNVRPGGAYSYYLVDIETDGTTTRHGPVSARVSIRPIVIPDERMRPGVNRPEILRVMSYMPRFWPSL